MFLPIGDQPNPTGTTPVVNYALIALNVAVYVFVTLPLSYASPEGDPLLPQYIALLQELTHGQVSTRELLSHVSAYDLFVFRHGFRPADPSIAAIFTSMFLHGGLLHLAGNMLFLWIYGDNVEYRLGRLGYLVAYLGTGVAATLFHALFAGGSPLPTVGASGAISGVLGFYFVFFPRNQVRLLLLFFPFLVDVFLVPARLVLGFFLLIDNVLPFLVARGAEGGGIAHGAHIGGFIAGLGVAWVLDRRERVRRPREFSREPERAEQDVTALVHQGRFAEAAKAYFAERERRSEHDLAPADALALGHWLAHHGHSEAALTVYRRVLAQHSRGPYAAEAHAAAGRVLLESLGRPTGAWQHFLDALDLGATGESERMARSGLAAIERMQRMQVRRR